MRKPKGRYAYYLISVLIVLCGFLILFFQHFESIGVQNSFINILKRCVAQSSFLIFKIHDPYRARIHSVSTGSVKINDEELKDFRVDQEHFQNFFKEKNIKFKIIKYNNESIIKSQYPFHYAAYLNDRLLQLKNKYKLYQVIQGNLTEYQQLIKLGQWINKQWKAGTPQNVPFNFNAMEIIERGNKGERFFCSEYATTFVQAALSLGFQARYVGLMGTKGHVVAEVWSHDLHKWFVIDNYFNVVYKLNHVPLNALEVHNLWCANRWKEIEVLETARPFTEGISIYDDPFRMMDAYSSFYIRMRNDWYSNPLPHGHPLSNSIMNGVEYRDSCSKDSMLIATETSNNDDLYWDLNKTTIYLRPMEGQFQNGKYVFEGVLDTVTPDFKEFSIDINGKYSYLNQNKIVWQLSKGFNSLSVRSVDILGRKGSASTISIILD